MSSSYCILLPSVHSTLIRFQFQNAIKLLALSAPKMRQFCHSPLRNGIDRRSCRSSRSLPGHSAREDQQIRAKMRDRVHRCRNLVPRGKMEQHLRAMAQQGMRFHRRRQINLRKSSLRQMPISVFKHPRRPIPRAVSGAARG